LLYSQEGFDQVVLSGARMQRGMAAFADKLTADDAVAVREYIIARANEVKNAPAIAPGPGAAAAAQPAQQAPAAPVQQAVRQPAAAGAAAATATDVHDEAATTR
jgi:hypothetical protein